MANRIEFKVLGDVSNLEKNLLSAGQSVQRFGRNLTLGLTLPIALASSKFVSLASDAIETRNKFKQVMGDMIDDADEFTKGLSEGIGRNVTDLEEGLSAFQAFSKGLGFANDEAFKMSARLQALSLDFASFNNLSDEEALQRFISAMSGSSEVVDRFGISLKQSNLDLKLQELGLAKSVIAATETQKAVARLAIIEESLGRQGAVGDAVRTQGEFAGTMKRLKAEVKTLGEEMGATLIPAATELAQKAISLVKEFNSLDDSVKRNILTFGLILAALGPLVFTFSALVVVIAKTSIALTILNGFLGTTAFQVLGLNTSVKILAANIGILRFSLIALSGIGIAAFVGWNVGRLIGQVSGLDKAIENLAIRLDIFGNKSAQEISANAKAANAAALVRKKIFDEEKAQTQQNSDEIVEIVRTKEQQKLDTLLEFQNQTSILSDLELAKQIDFINTQISITKSLEDQKTKILETEVKKRQKLKDLEIATTQKAFSVLSDATKAFLGDSKAAAVILKLLSIGQAIVNTALGVTKALALGPTGIPIAKFIGVLGGIEIATIAATSFAVGTGNVRADTLANIHKGETIIPQDFASSIRSGELSLSGGSGGGGDNGSIVFDFSGAKFNGITPILVEEIFTIASENMFNKTLAPLPA